MRKKTKPHTDIPEKLKALLNSDEIRMIWHWLADYRPITKISFHQGIKNDELYIVIEAPSHNDPDLGGDYEYKKFLDDWKYPNFPRLKKDLSEAIEKNKNISPLKDILRCMVKTPDQTLPTHSINPEILWEYDTKKVDNGYSDEPLEEIADDAKSYGYIGKWLRDTDAANIKRIWNAFLYLRGMKSRVGLKSIPIDLTIFDELDEAPQNAVDMAMERMGHSEFREVLKLSNPTLPEYGIDKAFQETDQRYWLLKCEKCGEFTCLEDTFPDCLITVRGCVIRACQKCHSGLNPSIGQWVAKRPSITDKRGRHYSQLFSHFVAPADILHQFRTTTNLTDFYNLKIGIAYVEAENRLSVQEVLSLCSSEGIASEDPGPCSMGVDQGKDLHVVVGKKRPDKDGNLVHIGIYRDWEELDRLMKNFNVQRCVVDALPETRNARSFAERFKGRIYLNYYNEKQKGHYAWNEKELIVSCNRTESLDASHKEINDQSIIIPNECVITREFAKHLHNVAKKLEEDEETGSKRYVYVKLGPDHFRHAFNYEAMARQSSPKLLFPQFQ